MIEATILVFHYVLMQVHVHLLLSERTLQRLANSLRVLKGQTSKFLIWVRGIAVLADRDTT